MQLFSFVHQVNLLAEKNFRNDFIHEYALLQDEKNIFFVTRLSKLDVKNFPKKYLVQIEEKRSDGGFESEVQEGLYLLLINGSLPLTQNELEVWYLCSKVSSYAHRIQNILICPV